MKVKVIGKTAGDSTTNLNGKLFPAHARGWGYIHQVYRDISHIFLSDTSGGSQEWGAYHAADLEPYEPREKEYRQLKDITPRVIFAEALRSGTVNDCFMQEFTRFVTTFDLGYEEVLSFEHLEPEFDTEPEWEKWLIQHGFIERVVEEVIYAVGDRFSLKEVRGDKYLLSRVGDSMVALINLESGNLWTQPIRVKNGGVITQAELDTIIKSYSFVKIEGK